MLPEQTERMRETWNSKGCRRDTFSCENRRSTGGERKCEEPYARGVCSQLTCRPSAWYTRVDTRRVHRAGNNRKAVTSQSTGASRRPMGILDKTSIGDSPTA